MKIQAIVFSVFVIIGSSAHALPQPTYNCYVPSETQGRVVNATKWVVVKVFPSGIGYQAGLYNPNVNNQPMEQRGELIDVRSVGVRAHGVAKFEGRNFNLAMSYHRQSTVQVGSRLLEGIIGQLNGSLPDVRGSVVEFDSLRVTCTVAAAMARGGW